MKVFISKVIARNAITARLDELKRESDDPFDINADIKEAERLVLMLALNSLNNPAVTGIDFQ